MFWTILRYAKPYLNKCKRDNIGAFAAQAAFFIILSAIPFLMVFTSLLQYTPISKDYVMTAIYDYMPNYIQPFFAIVLTEVYSRSVGVLSISAIVALWSAGKALQYLTAGLNVLYGIDETRNWFVVRFWSVVYTLVLIFAIMAVLVLMVFNRHVQKLVGSFFDTKGIFMAIVSVRPFFRDLLVLGILTGLFLCFFTILPNKKVKAMSQLPGALLCALIWYMFTAFLALYISIFNNFSIYGSLSTLVLLMVWLYSCMYIMFLCAEANVVFGEGLRERFKRWKERRRKIS